MDLDHYLTCPCGYWFSVTQQFIVAIIPKRNSEFDTLDIQQEVLTASSNNFQRNPKPLFSTSSNTKRSFRLSNIV